MKFQFEEQRETRQDPSDIKGLNISAGFPDRNATVSLIIPVRLKRAAESWTRKKKPNTLGCSSR